MFSLTKTKKTKADSNDSMDIEHQTLIAMNEKCLRPKQMTVTDHLQVSPIQFQRQSFLSYFAFS